MNFVADQEEELMGTLAKMLAGYAALLVIVIAGVWCQQDNVIDFHQYPGNYTQQLGFKPDHKDRGYVKDCKPSGGYFNLSWTPKELDPTQQARIYLDAVSPINLDKGKVSLSVYYEGNLLVSVSKKSDCQTVISKMTNWIPASSFHITCPVKKGDRLTGDFVYSTTEKLIGYDGHYKIVIEIYDHKEVQLLCLEADMDVLPLSQQ